eukprot:c44045_g1_i1 orf=187-468(-)
MKRLKSLRQESHQSRRQTGCVLTWANHQLRFSRAMSHQVDRQVSKCRRRMPGHVLLSPFSVRHLHPVQLLIPSSETNQTDTKLDILQLFLSGL